VSAIEKFIPVFAALRRLEAQRNAVKHPIMARWDLPIPCITGQATPASRTPPASRCRSATCSRPPAR